MMIMKPDTSRTSRRYGGRSLNLHRTKYRYGGNGIFSNLIGRKLLSGDNVKKLINAVSKSNVIQKAANAVQDGATSAIKSQTQKGLEELASRVISQPKKKKKKRTREHQNILNTVTQHIADTIPTTASIEGIVRRGKGIVYD